MHAVAGLLELGRTDEALGYLTEVQGTAAEFDDTLRAQIAAPQIVGLLLGKAAEASERGIHLEIAPDTWLSESPEKLQVLTTIVGNLVDNAIEALADRTDELRGSLGPAEGAAGSVYVPLVLTNIGGRTCELRGFPGVSYVAGNDGHQVGPAAAMSGPRGEVVLKPGAAAAAQLQLVNVANFDAGLCRPTPVRGLRVYPPGDTTSLFIERAGTGCAGPPPGNQLSVQTLTPA